MATATLPTQAPTSAPTTATTSFAAILDRLGGIDPARVLVLQPLGAATEADLIWANDHLNSLYELVDGFLVEKGMGYTESRLATVLAGYLNAFILPRNLGLVAGADGIMRTTPGHVREPDISYASWDRIPGRCPPAEPIAGFAPDLAVEVLSRSNTRAEMTRKRAEYFAAGTRLVWEIDPPTRTVAVYTAPEGPTTLDATMTLDGGDVLPGFALPLADLFAELDRHG